MKLNLPTIKTVEDAIPFEGFDKSQSDRIRNILKKVPDQIVRSTFSKIKMDTDMDDGEKYRAYGKYNPKTRIMLISPKAFKTLDEFDDGKNKMSKLEHCILHEIGHYVDSQKGISKDPKWLQLSGWSDKPTDEEHVMMVIPQENSQDIHTSWYYKKNADFPRWYAKRSPKDDWSECFAFYVGGLYDRFKDKNKLNYVKETTNGLGVRGASV